MDGLRQRPSLLRLLRPLHAPRDHAHQPGRPRGDPRRRSHVDPVRPVPRPAARVPARGERLRCAGRLARERRRQHRVLAVERQLVGQSGQRSAAQRRQRHEQLGAVRHPRRRLVERAVRHRRPGRRGRLDGRDADSVQEPAVSVAGLGAAAPLGLPDHPDHPRQVGGAVVVADLARCGRSAHAVRHARWSVRPVAEPQPGAPARGDRVQARLARHRHRRVHHRRSHRRAGIRRQVRAHAQPDGGRHLQPRLLADRVGPAADRDESAVRAVLSRAAPVLPRRAGDLPDRDPADPGPHPYHRRPPLRGQADRQGGPGHARVRRGRRRGGGPSRRRGTLAVRHHRADHSRTRPVRLLRRVVSRGYRHGARVRSRLQPGGRGRRAVPAGTDPPRELPRGGLRDAGTMSVGSLSGGGDRGGLLEAGAQSSATTPPTAASIPVSPPTPASCRASTFSRPAAPRRTGGGPSRRS